MIYCKTILKFIIMKRAHVFFAMVAAVCGICSCANSGKSAGKPDGQAEKEIIVLDTLTRADIIRLPIEEQTQVMGEVTPEKKAELFRYKLTKDLESGSLNGKETALIRELLDGLSPKIYTDSTAKAEFKELGNGIVAKLRDECGWDDIKIAQYTETIMTAAECEEHANEARKKEAEMRAKGYTGI